MASLLQLGKKTMVKEIINKTGIDQLTDTKDEWGLKLPGDVWDKIDPVAEYEKEAALKAEAVIKLKWLQDTIPTITFPYENVFLIQVNILEQARIKGDLNKSVQILPLEKWEAQRNWKKNFKGTKRFFPPTSRLPRLLGKSKDFVASWFVTQGDWHYLFDLCYTTTKTKDKTKVLPIGFVVKFVEKTNGEHEISDYFSAKEEEQEGNPSYYRYGEYSYNSCDRYSKGLLKVLFRKDSTIGWVKLCADSSLLEEDRFKGHRLINSSVNVGNNRSLENFVFENDRIAREYRFSGVYIFVLDLRKVPEITRSVDYHYYGTGHGLGTAIFGRKGDRFCIDPGLYNLNTLAGKKDYALRQDSYNFLNAEGYINLLEEFLAIIPVQAQ